MVHLYGICWKCISLRAGFDHHAQVTECVSAIFAGAAFDGLRLSATTVVLIMAGVAAVTAVAWVAYALSQWPRGGVDPDQAHQQDEEELLPTGSV